MWQNQGDCGCYIFLGQIADAVLTPAPGVDSDDMSNHEKPALIPSLTGIIYDLCGWGTQGMNDWGKVPPWESLYTLWSCKGSEATKYSSPAWMSEKLARNSWDWSPPQYTTCSLPCVWNSPWPLYLPKLGLSEFHWGESAGRGYWL